MSNSSEFHPLGNAELADDSLSGTADIDPRLTRTNYFDGRLLKASDLIRDQVYLDQRVREIGQVFGAGIHAGLSVRFLTEPVDQLIVGPGVGITARGRVLALRESLEIEIDRARIGELNNGAPFHFNRGLYAVVLSYVEEGKRIAEVFPQDLGAERLFNFDVTAEGVQIGLVQLPQALPQQDSLLVRSQLATEDYTGLDLSGVVPEDGIPLGVLAIRNDRPQWLDAELLRGPLRSVEQLGDREADLARRYEALYLDVIAERRDASENGDFPATRYFRSLPPVGSLPKDSVDPPVGRQSFFPENYSVFVAPVRVSDVALLREESLKLPALDLGNQPADVVVLAPLSNLNYGRYARRLEVEFDPLRHRLPFIHPLRLRLHRQRIDTDQAAWRDIWDLVDERQLLYVRRPVRAAETAISGIVLAQGTVPPAVPGPGPDLPGVDEPRLLDERAALLRHIGFDALAEQRPPTNAGGRNSVTSLIDQHDDDPAIVLGTLRVLLKIDRRYDGVIWQTIRRLVSQDTLAEFDDLLTTAGVVELPSSLIVDNRVALGITAALSDRWVAIDA